MKYKVAIPVETKSRELDGKLWLAAHLLQAGYDVVIGEASELDNGLDIVQPDVLITVSAGGPRSKIKLFQELKRKNVQILCLDVEGGIFRTDEGYSVRLGPEILEYIDYYLAWGYRQAQLISELAQYPSNKVVVTGEPKFDLLHAKYREYYSKAASLLRAKYGKYILINTNFGMINHFNTRIKEKLMTDEGISRLRKPTEELELVPFQSELLREFVNAISTLSSKNKDTNFIVRPHPSEDHKLYTQAFSASENVHVLSTGDVHSWIVGSHGVIHNNCTTAIEAVMLDKPAIAYCPIHSDSYELILPNAISRKAKNINELDSLLIQCLINKLPAGLRSLNKEQFDLLALYFENVDGCAAKRIIDHLDNMQKQGIVGKRGLISDINLTKYHKVKRGLNALLGASLTDTIESIAMRVKGLHISRQYTRQKFSVLRRDEIHEKLALMLQILRMNEMQINIRHISSLSNCFSLYRT